MYRRDIGEGVEKCSYLIIFINQNHLFDKFEMNS